MSTEKFKNILKDLRLERGIKQKEVAKSCDISPQCISQLELGTRSPTGTTLIALADFFNCSVDYLLGRTEEYNELDITHNTELPIEEKELLLAFRELSEDMQKHIIKHIKQLNALCKENEKLH